MASVPRLDSDTGKRLVPIEGQPPDLAGAPAGCAFAPALPHTIDLCRRCVRPLARRRLARHQVAWYFGEVEAMSEPLLRVDDLKSPTFAVKTGANVPQAVAAVRASDGCR